MDKILGVKVDNLSQKEVLGKITGFLDDGKFHQISTINPEFILEAQKNAQYKEILNNCDLNIADGFGIKCAFWRFGKHLKYRFIGVNLMLEMLKIAENRGLSVFLACRKDGLSNFEETKAAILKLYSKLAIEGADLDINANEFKIPMPTGRQENSKFKILLCSFGAPQQEIFLDSLKNDIIGVAMGVGGSFDFLTGHICRAPKLFQKLGLEWLWRLFQEPRYRWKRIWNAVIIFPIKIILNKKI